jgi:hypothetical protein
MALDREQWIHLATANAAIIRADLDRLRNLLTEGPQVGYAEFWAQARDIAAKFKTFKPIEAEARENLWSDYRAICEATRALQESERGHFAEESKAKRAQIEAALVRAAEVVEAAQTPQELSRAQSLLDQILNQMKTRPAKETEPRRKKTPAVPPSEQGEPPVDASGAIPQPAEAEAPNPGDGDPAEPEVRDDRTELQGEIHPPPGEAPILEAVESQEATTTVIVEGARTDSSAPLAEDPASVVAADPDHQGPPPPAASDAADADPTAAKGVKEAPVLLRSDREACWTRWTQIRDVLKAKRTEHRRHLLESAMVRAQEILASVQTQDPRTVQETIRVAQGELKASGLSLAEQEAVRATLRSAWKASSERIESLRQERQKAHSEWLERMSAHLSRWETQVLKNQATAVQSQGEVADLESQAAGSSDDGRGSKLRQWINGKRLRLADLEASIKELGQKIHTVRTKMGKEAPPPITELSEEDFAAASRPSPTPSPERRSGPVREARGPSRGPGRGPARGPRDERPSEPPSHPGLNLGELLAQHLGLAIGGKVAESKLEESKVAASTSEDDAKKAAFAYVELSTPELGRDAEPVAGEPENPEPGHEGTEAEG